MTSGTDAGPGLRRSGPPARGSELGRFIGLDSTAWRDLDQRSRTAAVFVIAAWVVLAWNRFGAQGLGAPRVATRFVLVGVYAWLGLAAALWLTAAIAASVRQRSATVGMSRRDAVAITAIAHKPAVVFAVALQISSLIVPVGGIGTVLAALCIGFWMPATLVGGVSWATRAGLPAAAAITVVPYLLWLGTAGRFLLDRLGHLR